MCERLLALWFSTMCDNNTTQCGGRPKLGTDFAASHNPNMRKGALVGLAAVAIALGTENMGAVPREGEGAGQQGGGGGAGYTADLIRPILTCMSDTDSRVRYYACESLYNVTKVSTEQF